MALKMSKTPLMIAAIATAVALTSNGVARADTVQATAAITTADAAQVVQANFKIKKRSIHHKRGFKQRSFHRHRSFHQRGFVRTQRGFKHRGFVHHPKSRTRIIIKKRY